MATNPFDQLGKKIGLRALGPSGRTDAQHEIHANARQADLRHEPAPAREAERARLGLLGRLASVPCLIEMFSSAPGEETVVDCLGKLIPYRQERRRQAKKAKRRRRDQGNTGPAPPFVKPFLWIITAGHPTSGMFVLGAVRAEGWPRGVYVTPAAPPNAGRSRRPGLRREPGGLCVGFIVASELPRERETILVRIMAGGAALSAAVTELAALPAGAYEQEVASADVVELHKVLGQKSKRTKEEEAFIMSTRDAFEELREEGRREGRREGRDEGRREGRAEEAAHAVLAVLRARGVAVPEAVRDRILAEKALANLQRWLDKAAIASTITQVIDAPS